MVSGRQRVSMTISRHGSHTRLGNEKELGTEEERPPVLCVCLSFTSNLEINNQPPVQLQHDPHY